MHTVTIRARSTGRADHLCPVLRMHLVMVFLGGLESRGIPTFSGFLVDL